MSIAVLERSLTLAQASREGSLTRKAELLRPLPRVSSGVTFLSDSQLKPHSWTEAWQTIQDSLRRKQGGCREERIKQDQDH
jgi:hypothetical protein